MTPQSDFPRVYPLHPINSNWPAEHLSRCKSDNLNVARRISIRNKWQMFEKKLLMLTLMLRGKKKKARMSEEEYMLQGLLRAQENQMVLREMAKAFHPQLKE